jgi:hypothetical protein
VVYFESTFVDRELISGLLATRDKRDLQSVYFDNLEQADVAALVGELVGTDPHKEWECVAQFPLVEAASAFCRSAMRSASSTRTSSLTKIVATVDTTTLEGQKAFAALFAAHSGLRHFDVVTNDEVVKPPAIEPEHSTTNPRH